MHLFKTFVISCIVAFSNINCVDTNTSSTALTENYVNIPESKDSAVITDGIFSSDEWTDAKEIVVNENLILLLKHENSVFYIGLKCPELRLPVTDMFISSDGNSIYQFHISAQLGERKLASVNEEDPSWDFGNTSGWYGNEIRWNYSKARQLREEGKSASAAELESMFAHEGHEFVFRKDKFNGNNLFIRFEMMYSGNYDNPVIYPLETKAKDISNWLEIIFN